MRIIANIEKICTLRAKVSFYIKVKDIIEREKLIRYLRENEISAIFHYIPLHSALAGEQFSRFNGIDNYTTLESERLLRLPMFYKMSEDEVKNVVSTIIKFYIGSQE